MTTHAHHVSDGTKVCDAVTVPAVIMFAEAEAGGVDAIDCGECLACMALVYEKLAAALRARIEPAIPTCAAMPVLATYRGGGVPPGEWIEVTTDDPTCDPRAPLRSHRAQRLVVAKECADWRIDRLEIDGKDLLCGLVLHGSDFSGKVSTSLEYGDGFAFLIRATNMTGTKAPFVACWLVDPDPDPDPDVDARPHHPKAHHPECNDDRCTGGC